MSASREATCLSHPEFRIPEQGTAEGIERMSKEGLSAEEKEAEWVWHYPVLFLVGVAPTQGGREYDTVGGC